MSEQNIGYIGVHKHLIYERFLDNLLYDIHNNTLSFGKDLELNVSVLPLGGTTDTMILAGAIGELVRLDYVKRVENTDMFPCRVHLTIYGIKRLRYLDNEKEKAETSEQEEKQTSRQKRDRANKVLLHSMFTLLILGGLFLSRSWVNDLAQPVSVWVILSALATCMIGFLWNRSQRLIWFIGGILVCVVGIAPLLGKVEHSGLSKSTLHKPVVSLPLHPGTVAP